MADFIEEHLVAVFVAIVGVLVVVGVLASQPRHESVVAPDGKGAWLVTCSSPGGCVREASQICPSGYRVLSSDDKRGTSTTYVNTGNGVMVPFESDTFEGARMIRCGVPAVP